MHSPPTGFDEHALVQLVAARWKKRAERLTYAPVGFGSHHWIASDHGGGRRFVTVDDFRGGASAHRTMALRRAMRTAHILSGRSRHVVAPLPARDGHLVHQLGEGYAVSVFPFHEAARLEEPLNAKVRARVVDVLADLHDGTSHVTQVADYERFELPGRDALVAALTSLHDGGPPDVWMTGPYALPTRQLLARHEAGLQSALRHYDEGTARMQGDRRHWVVTHGEPHSRNILSDDGHLLLIDWDTVRIAPAARDLWHVEVGDGSQIAHYAAATGRAVPMPEIGFYRLKWDLMEICTYVEWFTTPHTATADAETGWGALVEAFDHVDQWPVDL
ncbi:phosphotransferase [Leekyejoonella antrihumi]|uniref:Aminoglycoside phosphotransferase domain-containing protein n=1 Tax=Leekyejoonella antrihumi TaxID=1660198 RepID=A0A563DVT3_9MICO|nr:phosphotransferase [Leekyejoonella antrihumi]TWP34378.1 hypothetical protein FGL98_17515 [Leekyejoonella antrihumi]